MPHEGVRFPLIKIIKTWKWVPLVVEIPTENNQEVWEGDLELTPPLVKFFEESPRTPVTAVYIKYQDIEELSLNFHS